MLFFIGLSKVPHNSAELRVFSYDTIVKLTIFIRQTALRLSDPLSQPYYQLQRHFSKFPVNSHVNGVI